jgi:hypothetical protein
MLDALNAVLRDLPWVIEIIEAMIACRITRCRRLIWRIVEMVGLVLQIVDDPVVHCIGWRRRACLPPDTVCRFNSTDGANSVHVPLERSKNEYRHRGDL